MWEVEFYVAKDNEIPIQGFLDKLDRKMRAKALRDILLLKELGTSMREPYSKHIKDGVFELRIKFASDISRIFYFFFVNNRIILTNGFIKKTNKTPSREIEKALKYKADFERRGKNE